MFYSFSFLCDRVDQDKCGRLVGGRYTREIFGLSERGRGRKGERGRERKREFSKAKYGESEGDWYPIVFPVYFPGRQTDR